MKKIFTTILFIIASFTFSKAQYVTIPDANFAVFLQQHYPTCMNGNQLDTTCYDILRESSVTCSSLKIADLTGIQYFKKLTDLGCGNNNLTTLPPLQASLRSFNCNNNQLSEIPTLPALLVYFNCSVNNITVLPALPAKLTDLSCSGNQISSLPLLPLTLYQLDCSSNPITNLPLLPNGLNLLHCQGNPLVSGLPTLPDSIQDINCAGCGLTSLPRLPSFLISLDCHSNSLTSLPALPQHLTNLFCYQNELTTLPAFPAYLTNLMASSNLLTGLTSLPKVMWRFDVSYNPDLGCIPPLDSFSGYAGGGYFNLAMTNVKCLPNAIKHTGSVPEIDTMPICTFFNTNGCQVALNIEGSVFKDENSNCVQDAGDKSVYNTKINLYQGDSLVQSGYFGGNYSFKTGQATYTVKVDTTNSPFYVSCPQSGDSTVTISSGSSFFYGVNFGVTCKPGFDVGAWDIHRQVGRHLQFFPGDTSKVFISAGDIAKAWSGSACAAGVSGSVKVIINGPATYYTHLKGSLTPAISNDTLIYAISDYSLVNSDSAFAVALITNSNAQTGDHVCLDVYVTPGAGDNNPANNYLEHCFTVGNSYDPNEKEVSPDGSLPLGFANWLTYTIHFQNTGVDAAANIQVLDTLDASLDAETFQLLAASVNPIVQINGNNVAFNFPNINLPDSSTDKVNSTGYVEYRIKPHPSLAAGTTIENKASIYFDFNAPVVTNTTLNTIEVLTTTPANITTNPLVVYPNPANQQLIVTGKQLTGSKIIITDMLGRTLLVQYPNGTKTIINVGKLLPGAYFIQVNSGSINQVSKFVKQ